VYSETCRRCDGVVDLFVEKSEHFNVLLLRLWLAWFSRVSRIWVTVRVSVRSRVRFSFIDRVGIGFPDVE